MLGAVAGLVIFDDGSDWSAAGWLFDFVIRQVARSVESPALGARLDEIEAENLGCLALRELTSSEQAEVLSVLGSGFVARADQVLPKDLARRSEVLEHLGTLVGQAEQLAGPGRVGPV